MVGSVLIWAPPGRGRRVPGARNGPFWPPKNPGACFWGRKKPLREWGHAIPRFSIETGFLGRRKTQGRVFWGRKKPLREARRLTPWFWARTGLEPHPDGAIPALAEGVAQHAPPQQQEPHLGVRTRCLRGASSVCQTTGQSDDGGPFGQGIP